MIPGCAYSQGKRSAVAGVWREAVVTVLGMEKVNARENLNKG